MGEIKISVLGPLRIDVAGRVQSVAGPKLTKLFALLVMRSNHFVDLELVAEELWANRPPEHAVSTIRTHAYHLRKSLDGLFPGHSLGRLVVTRPAGYTLQLEDDAVDAHRFQRLVERGRRLHDEGRYEEAASHLEQALGLWDGRAFADVPAGGGPVLKRYAAALDESRRLARDLQIGARMRLGQHGELIGELRALIAVDPLNEWLHAQLIDSLHRTGRRADALSAYRHAHRVLGEELGLQPSAELQRLQQQVLRAS